MQVLWKNQLNWQNSREKNRRHKLPISGFNSDYHYRPYGYQNDNKWMQWITLHTYNWQLR